MDELTCAGFDALAAELALEVADARERSAVVSHLEQCPRCRRELGQWSDVADGLLSLVPPVQPPAGFQARLLASLAAAREDGVAEDAGGSTVETDAMDGGIGGMRHLAVGGEASHPCGRSQSRGRRRLLVAAAVVVVLALGGGGWVLGARGPGSSTSATVPGKGAGAGPSTGQTGQTGQTGRTGQIGQVTTASLRAGDRSVGEVMMREGRDPWMSVAVQGVSGIPAGETVACQLRTTGGRTVAMGSFTLSDGYGYWAGAVPTTSTVVAAELVGSGGRVIATATLPGEAHPAH